MKTNKLTVTALSIFAIVLTFAAVGFAQPAGGYKPVDNPSADAGVGLAADFAVKGHAAKTKTTITLDEIAKAEDQAPKLGARNFRMCLKVTASGKQSFAQTVVTMDQYSNLKLISWAASTCGSDYRPVDKPDSDAGVGLAADFAVKERSAKTKTTTTLDDVAKAEDQEPKLGARNFRLCLKVTTGNKQSFAQTVVTMDLYSNLKLVSWAPSNCGGAVDGYRPVDNPDSDAGVGLAADFAIKEHAAKAKTTITLDEIAKAEDQEPKLGARNFRLCLKVTTNGKQSVNQAIVTMDQYSNLKLVSWAASTCH